MDITMCLNVKCPLKLKCLRYMAKPDGWQSYAKFQPTCQNLLPYKGKRKRRYVLIGELK